MQEHAGKRDRRENVDRPRARSLEHDQVRGRGISEYPEGHRGEGADDEERDQETGDAALGIERLLEDVWEMSPDVTTRTVDTHVKRLREKLGSAGDYVETVRGVGYRFAEEVEGVPEI